MGVRSRPLDEQQLQALQWVADGCDGQPSLAMKQRVNALANRNLVTVKRGKAGWRATITDDGRFYLEHGTYPRLPERDKPAEPPERQERRGRRPESPFDDEAVRRIIQDTRFHIPAPEAKRRKLRKKAIYTHEVTMKFEVKITRVQVATRYVTATDQEAAAEKVREQLAERYGFYANSETVGTDIEVTQAIENHVVRPVDLTAEGPVLIPLAQAARATGISYGQLGQFAADGSIEQVRLGNRRYLKRKSLVEFIERNTYRGWAY